MIEEIDTEAKFDDIFSSCIVDIGNRNPHFGLGEYDQIALEYFRSMLAKNIRNPEILPFIKIWAYKHKGEYISGVCFHCERNPLTTKRVMSETFWTSGLQYGAQPELDQTNESKSFIEKMSLIKLLKHAEKYGEQNYFDYIRMGKVIGAHSETLDNFYLKSGYRADSMIFSKRLAK